MMVTAANQFRQRPGNRGTAARLKERLAKGHKSAVRVPENLAKALISCFVVKKRGWAARHSKGDLLWYQITMGQEPNERHFEFAPYPERGALEVRRAAIDGVATGLRDHLPAAIGLFLTAVVIGASASFNVFVLGGSPRLTSALAAAAFGSVLGVRTAARHRRSEGSSV
jgi:hypothetical protein